MSSHSLKISISNGTLTAIYDDAHVGLIEMAEESKIRRASHVEPCDGGWSATMEDSTVLGPFRLRSEALAAEVQYLSERLF